MTTFLGNDSVLKKVLDFSLPYLLSYFLQTLYGMADLLIIGRFDGVAATTAVSIGSQVMHMSTVMLVGLAMGVTVGIGHAVGAGEQRRGGAHPVPCAECGKSFHGRRRGHCGGRVVSAGVYLGLLFCRGAFQLQRLFLRVWPQRAFVHTQHSVHCAGARAGCVFYVQVVP